MRIAILGATGHTGIELTRRALARGHEVIAVVRDPAKLDTVGQGTVGQGAAGQGTAGQGTVGQGAAGSRAANPVTIRTADARSTSELAAAIDGADAIAFCIGPAAREHGRLRHDAIIATLEAMKAARIYRVAAISASGPFVDGDDPLTRFVAKPIIQRIFANDFADLRAMESLIRGSETEWTIVRPPQLTDGTPRGHYRSRRDGNVRWGFQIRRADLATAMLDVLLDDSTICETISVAN